MKIFASPQIRRWDEASIREQGIRSIDLMERAATACVVKILELFPGNQPVLIFCGTGNNGGDGLAIARLLKNHGLAPEVYLAGNPDKRSNDNLVNLEKIASCNIPVRHIRNREDFPAFDPDTLLIDALFGIGLNTALHGLEKQLIDYLNTKPAAKVSIDIPSGLFPDKQADGCTVFKADDTLSFQSLKRAFLFPESEEFTGRVHVLDIGLSENFHDQEPCDWVLTDMPLVRARLKPLSPFAHKGKHGHAALVAGSRGMMGAALLAATACLRTGAGKLTCYVPESGYNIMQTGRPEAMCRISGKDHITEVLGADKFDAIGIGPGLGISAELYPLLEHLITHPLPPAVFDADAINGLALHPGLMKFIPLGSILTPHPKEMDNLAGAASNHWERLEHACRFAEKHDVYIVLKGRYSRLISPEGALCFNSTGNAGMAKGGSGDVLTGILTSLRAQGYNASDSMIIGTYLHGLAGDMAAAHLHERALLPGDLAELLAEAWKKITG